MIIKLESIDFRWAIKKDERLEWHTMEDEYGGFGYLFNVDEIIKYLSAL